MFLSWDFGVMCIETSTKVDFHINTLFWFWKIAVALLRMDTFSSIEHEDMVDVNFYFTISSSQVEKNGVT